MFLESFRKRIETALPLAIERMGEKGTLRDACEYALLSGGKRLRPSLVLMIAEALGNRQDALPAALSVEFFHTASLIADDLPCMDNDDWRRGKPSLHKAFGESTAILASYTLIAAGYGGIYENCEKMRRDPLFQSRADAIALVCLDTATRCAGLKGATQGQFLDLFPTNSERETLEKIVYQKTSTLFEVSFVFGWLFGGGDPAQLELLRRSASHLGMAFQIADDLEDGKQDATHAGSFNFVSIYGEREAERICKKEMLSFRQSLEKLGLWTPPVLELYRALERGREPLPL